MNIETLINLLSHIQEVQFLRTMHDEGVHLSVYQGSKGIPVFIETTEEEIDEGIVREHFKNLGVDDFYYDFIPKD